MKKWSTKDKTSGFTIIEVMIVLAIAGLIMVIVFFAVPQLQRNQRDNARQNVTNRLMAELDSYAGNNQGQYPIVAQTGSGHTIQTFTSNYLSNFERKNPRTGADYSITLAGAYGDNPTENQILLYRGGQCVGEGAQAAPGGSISGTSSRALALRTQLDNGTSYYCVDNN